MPRVDELVAVHAVSFRHRPMIERSRICGCFHCEEFFPLASITTWLTESAQGDRPAGETAVCPKCGIDAVLPEWNGIYPMGTDILRRMRRRWFGEGREVVEGERPA